MTDFFIADTHLGHRAIIKFTNAAGIRHRPFDSIEDHNEHIVNSINSVVGKNDKLYILGDVVFGTANLHYLSRINCLNLYLIAGNHDCYSSHTYLEHFNKIFGQIEYKSKIVLSHMPVHEMEVGVGNRYALNLHGHLHTLKVLLQNGVSDPRYFCVSCEQLNYIPISYEEILERNKDLF